VFIAVETKPVRINKQIITTQLNPWAMPHTYIPSNIRISLTSTNVTRQ